MFLSSIHGIFQLLTIMSARRNVIKNNTEIKSIPLCSISQRSKKDDVVMIPRIGLGTYKFTKGSGLAEKAVLDALELGYRYESKTDNIFYLNEEITML